MGLYNDFVSLDIKLHILMFTRGRVMINSKLMLVDRDGYTSSILANSLFQRGYKDIQIVTDGDALPKAVAECRPDVTIFNYHFNEFDSLILCNTLKRISPHSLTIAIVSPGPAFKTVDLWAKQTNSIDLIIEKPLSDERFFTKLGDLLKIKSSSKMLETRAQLLVNLIPEPALSAIEPSFNNEAKMFQAIVLFTDIRRSTELIREMEPRIYFRLLNDLLSAQAKLIKQYEGQVIKYTGDGVMATFNGMGSSYLAMRCALALAKASHNIKCPYGVGVAEGLVLAGLIGDSKGDGQRLQYDVIGATVHLAARLCGLASAGEVITTKKLIALAKFKENVVRDIKGLSIKGFADKIDIVALSPYDLSTERDTDERTI